MTYRIAPTYRLKWKVQKKHGFFWKDVGRRVGDCGYDFIIVHEFGTEKDAEAFIDERIVQDAEDEKDRLAQQLHMMTKPRIYPSK